MSLDSVEIVVGWEKSFGISIADAEATALRTPRQSIDLIAAKLLTQDEPRRGCLTLRAFHRLRCSIVSAAFISRAKIRPDARLRDLIGTERRRTWETVRTTCGIPSLPGLGWFTPSTVGDLARWTVVHAAKELKRPGEPWTRWEIRSVVREVITDVTGVEDFEDDHDFVHDIGID